MVPVQVIIDDDDMDKLKRIAVERGQDIHTTLISVLKQGLEWEEKARISPRQFKEFIMTLQNFAEYQGLVREQLSLISELTAQGTDTTKLLLSIMMGDEKKTEAILETRLEEIRKLLKEGVRK
jgi:hemerythrin-like domain-containing protein